MKRIQDIIDRRNELFEKMMDNFSFMMVYNSDLMEDEYAEDLMSKMQKLDAAIYDFQHEDCQDEDDKKLENIEELIREIEEYV